MKAPAYGWLIGITDLMNTEHGRKWAYTGSFAMYCIAAANGRDKCREPHDLDIMVEEGNVSNTWTNLAIDLKALRNGEQPGPGQAKGRLTDVTIKVDQGNGKILPMRINIDILAAGTRGGFGTLENCRTLALGKVAARGQQTMMRVVSVKTLLNSKTALMQGDPRQCEGYSAYMADFLFLKGLTDRGWADKDLPKEKKGASPDLSQGFGGW